jgi:ADP-ribosyl-[dinitrogen reductase] hydrolase
MAELVHHRRPWLGLVRRARRGLGIRWLEHQRFTGAIGLTRMPGLWPRSLADDLATIRACGASSLVSLTRKAELRWAGAGDFGAAVARAGLVWHHLPIRDLGVPDAAFEDAWRVTGPQLRRELEAGRRLVLHCYAGLGRAGLVAARLLIEFGELPERAIGLVRAVRPGAIQTAEQEVYLEALCAGAAAPLRRLRRAR